MSELSESLTQTCQKNVRIFSSSKWRDSDNSDIFWHVSDIFCHWFWQFWHFSDIFVIQNHKSHTTHFSIVVVMHLRFCLFMTSYWYSHYKMNQQSSVSAYLSEEGSPTLSSSRLSSSYMLIWVDLCHLHRAPQRDSSQFAKLDHQQWRWNTRSAPLCNMVRNLILLQNLPWHAATEVVTPRNWN